MGQVVNGIEVIQRSKDNNDYVVVPATATDVWAQDTPLYWDTSANVVKAFVPADSTTGGLLQAALIGLAQAGKKTGEDKAVVCKKCTILADSTGQYLGARMVVLYNATTLKYSFYEDAAYDAAYEPDISLSGDFAVCAAEDVEADGRGKIFISGAAHLAGLS